MSANFDQFTICPLQLINLDEVNSLIEESFEYKKENFFKNDFFFLFTSENIHNCRLLKNEKNEIIGHIGVSIREIKIHEQTFKLSLLGGICLKNEYRGKGIFKKFFQKVIEEFQASTSLSILWSGEPEIYQQYGFFLAIEQFSYPTNQFKNKFKTYQQLMTLTLNDKDNIKSLYQQFIEKKYVTIRRTENEWHEIFNSNIYQLYIRKDDNSKIDSYFMVNKGQDLEDVIHEIAIEKIETFNTPDPNFTLWLPELIQNATSEIQYGALVRINNPQLFADLMTSMSNGIVTKLKYDLFHFNFEFNKQNYRLNPQDLFLGIFGPGRYKEFSEFHGQFYICGLDSV